MHAADSDDGSKIPAHPRLDFKYLAENEEEAVLNSLMRRYNPVDVKNTVWFYNQRQELQKKLEGAQHSKKVHSAQGKGGKGAEMGAEEREKMVEEGKRIKEEIQGLEEKLHHVKANAVPSNSGHL